jgi:transcriptional regulator with XRE-family HTH domain
MQGNASAIINKCNLITMKNTVKSRLEDMLKSSGMTEYDLAKASGVEYTTIHRIITGETEKPSRNTLLPIAKALGTSPEFLKTGIGAKEAPSEQNIMERALKLLEEQISKKDQTIAALTEILRSVTGGKAGSFLTALNGTGLKKRSLRAAA